MSICIFYTCLVGIKAVIWTDVFQIIVMYGVMLLIMVKGTMDVGGLGFVFEKNMESGRLERPE
jgi:solute carrier family 5 (sodium-coupled monocarboxylate transporter), member 8/12